MSSRATLILVAVLGTIAGSIIGLPSLFGAGGEPPPASPDQASDEPVVTAVDDDTSDQLPEAIRQSESAKQFAVPLDAERAPSQEGVGLWVVDGVDDQLCLVQTTGEGRDLSWVTTCAARQQLSETGAVLVEGYGLTEDYTVAGIVPDGYETASASGDGDDVNSNVFLIQPDDAYGHNEMTIEGDDVGETSLPIGIPRPPEGAPGQFGG